MGAHELQATVLEDRPLPGVAQRLDDLRDLDVDDAAAQLRAGLEAEGLRRATERTGVDRLRRVIAGLRDEDQTVEELGEASVGIELLALHVPQAGALLSASARSVAPNVASRSVRSGPVLAAVAS